GLRRVALGLLPDQLVRPLSLGALVLAFLLIAGRGPEATETMVLAVASTLLALAFGQHWLRTCLPEGWRRAARETRSGEWRRVSFPLLLVAGLRRILQQTDVLVIGMVLGTTSAGIYFVAVRLAQLVAAGLGAVNSITAPLISELYSAGDHRQLQRTITHAAWGASLTSIPACLVLIFGRDFFLGLFGPEFTAAGASLILLCLAQIANALTGPVGWLLNMTGHQQVNARILAWITALNLVLNLPAILLWGIEGAALVTALLSAANNLWTWAVVRRRLKIDASVLSSWS
ncbi:MAG: polysaccharide biosynthesis C-terminal domain-containing protein, partial [Acidobacteria bacterium]|nr:polysaccharide biosynthesis C-terminal domain-containing protein [Acidobacteriota bacterium]